MRTLALLADSHPGQTLSAYSLVPRSSHGSRVSSCAVGAPIVRLIDRPSSTSLTVSWRDALTGHYGDQLWRAKKAATRGICALTGRQIERGDAVYSPARGKHPPRNCNAMICADCVEVFTVWR
ncbi:MULTISPECIES: DUF3331 domain-containing protein [unclassified Caballeronia]|uniref:DUF3331 domain-containing protein n=1 Tax=unclassified Caballeronia TaxID=2646786 RepID=UPI0028581F29|nr:MULTISPECIES: DUF3331 domain-containing protein [unclassified Caballeronia]MDR5777568.1 DUF3331 domain-containing protein [Caballeronia sp. LZ002]MDR5852991.1 DUF3331 domain-containing protein [Caballeronia sp. LZ003]